MHRSAAATDSDEDTLRVRATIIALMKAADAARRAMTRSLEPFGLTLPQFNVLTILLHHAELPTFQVAARMVEATPGITRLVTTLEAKRLIKRVQADGDRRQHLCSLTSRGRQVVTAAVPPFTSAQRGLLAALNKAESLQMTDLLHRVDPSPPAAMRTPQPQAGRRKGRP